MDPSVHTGHTTGPPAAHHSSRTARDGDPRDRSSRHPHLPFHPYHRRRATERPSTGNGREAISFHGVQRMLWSGPTRNGPAALSARHAKSASSRTISISREPQPSSAESCSNSSLHTHATRAALPCELCTLRSRSNERAGNSSTASRIRDVNDVTFPPHAPLWGTRLTSEAVALRSTVATARPPRTSGATFANAVHLN